MARQNQRLVNVLLNDKVTELRCYHSIVIVFFLLCVLIVRVVSLLKGIEDSLKLVDGAKQTNSLGLVTHTRLEDPQLSIGGFFDLVVLLQLLSQLVSFIQRLIKELGVVQLEVKGVRE